MYHCSDIPAFKSRCILHRLHKQIYLGKRSFICPLTNLNSPKTAFRSAWTKNSLNTLATTRIEDIIYVRLTSILNLNLIHWFSCLHFMTHARHTHSWHAHTCNTYAVDMWHTHLCNICDISDIYTRMQNTRIYHIYDMNTCIPHLSLGWEVFVRVLVIRSDS